MGGKEILFMALATVVMLLLTCFFEVAVSETCYKDSSLGNREGNVYYCNSRDLPRCCTQDGVQVCCVSESKKNITEQLQLWGAVAGFILLIGILFVCCKNDISFCNSEVSLKERWHNFRHKNKNKEAHLVSKDKEVHGMYYDNPVGDFGGPSGYYPPMREPYHFPSLSPDQKVKDYNHLNQSYA